MAFAEDLPEQCPPQDAAETAWQDVYRLTFEAEPTVDSFHSHAALNRPIPQGLTDLCAWASCSLTTDPKALKKLRKLRHPYVAKLNLPAHAGASRKHGAHIDLWRYDEFDIVGAIVSVEEV